jgi:hypothetical protein
MTHSSRLFVGCMTSYVIAFALEIKMCGVLVAFASRSSAGRQTDTSYGGERNSQEWFSDRACFVENECWQSVLLGSLREKREDSQFS